MGAMDKSASDEKKNLLGLKWQGEHTGRLLVLMMVILGFTVVIMVVVELTGGAKQFRSMVEDAGAWAPLVFVLLKASTYVIAPLSGSSIVLASGAVFGVMEGIALSVAGDTLGGSINYWIGRTLGRAGITRFAGKKALSQVDQVASNVANWRILLGARIVLSSLYDFVSYAAGLARISFSQFVIVTTVGGVPTVALLAFLGDASVESPATSYIMIAVASVSFVACCITYFAHRRQKKTSRS